ncbi:MAG: hypothetical protein JNL62_24050 [Bryobacterales bacterium]|nr:hypothetical protein [Bryobacterales bacterium]
MAGSRQTWAVDLSIFGAAPEFVVLYEHEHSPGVERPRMRMAECIRFENNRIAEIEVFIGRELPPLQHP